MSTNLLHKFRLLEILRHVNGSIQNIRKEMISQSVPGLLMVREDLKSKKTCNGQVHNQPVKKPKVSMTDGSGYFSQSEVPVN